MTFNSLAKVLISSVFAAGAASAAFPAAADFPEKPITVVVAYTAGGPTDVVARVVGQKMGELLGQSIVIENKPGAAGVIGTERALGAKPDGYTLLMATMGNLSVNPILYPKLKDLKPGVSYEPISQVTTVDFVLVSQPDFPAHTVQEVIEAAKAKPAQITTATSGVGGAPYLASMLFQSLADVELSLVPYKGTADAVNGLLGGQVSLDFDSVSQVLPFIRDKRLKPIAVLGAERSSLLPDVPTMKEAGLSDYDLSNWFGLVAPSGTPEETLDIIRLALDKAVKDPEVSQKLRNMGLSPVGSTSAEFLKIIERDADKWAKIVAPAQP